MTLEDLIAAELPFLREQARSRMIDAFDIGVPTGDTEYDPETQTEVDVVTPLFATPGYIPPTTGASNLSQANEAGGRTVLTARREIRIPWDAGAVPPNAVAVCVAVGILTPERMLNKRYRVGGSDGASHGTACHLEIVEELA